MLAIVASFSAIVLFAAPSQAATVKTFTVEFEHQVTSGSWSHNGGAGEWWLDCNAGDGKKFTFALSKKNSLGIWVRQFDTSEVCDTRIYSSAGWTGTAGTYRFELYTENTGVIIKGTGWVEDN
ncbi:hypothetical protein [Promicromonospora xylanilytica]